MNFGFYVYIMHVPWPRFLDLSFRTTGGLASMFPSFFACHWSHGGHPQTQSNFSSCGLAGVQMTWRLHLFWAKIKRHFWQVSVLVSGFNLWTFWGLTILPLVYVPLTNTLEYPSWKTIVMLSLATDL